VSELGLGSIITVGGVGACADIDVEAAEVEGTSSEVEAKGGVEAEVDGVAVAA